MQAEKRDTADLHAGHRARILQQRERRLVLPRPLAKGVVDVEPMRRQHHAKRHLLKLRFRAYEGRVHRIFGRHVVMHANRRGVSKRRVAGPDFEGQAGGGERQP